MQAVVRAWLPAVAVLIVGWLCALLAEPHAVVPATAPADAFSALRARRVLAAVLGPQQPHPVGSAADAAVQARIVAQFQALGIPVQRYSAFVCNTWRGFSFIPCATVHDLIAEVRPGVGRAVLMLAHADSVAAGPGAADDGAGVACVLEVARALRSDTARAIAPASHPVLALISDGEEAGLLGAAAFLQNPTLAAQVGAAVNVEARGTRGASLLFQTSPGDAPLVQAYARQVRFSATSSLFASIYRRLPNDTDLTLFIRAGIPAVNFAIAENVQAYHTPLDRIATLSPASLQMQGDNLLAMVRALDVGSFARLHGSDALYVSVLGYFLPHMPRVAALPLTLAVWLLLLWASWRARAWAAPDAVHASRALRAAAAPLLMIGGSVLNGYLLSTMAVWLSGSADPAYAHPLALRTALELDLWLMLLLTCAMAGPREMIAAVWLWIATLAVLAALYLPGLVPYLLWPATVAGLLLWLSAHARGRWDSAWGRRAALIAALATLVLWLPLASGSEALLGLRLQAAFTLSGSLALTPLLPLIGTGMSKSMRRASIAVCAAGALLCALIAGLQPPYSAAAPERLDLLYLEHQGKAYWVADSTWNGQSASLPRTLQHAARFQARPLALPGLLRASAFVADAGAPRLPLPGAGAHVTAAAAGDSSAVTLRLTASADTDQLDLYLPADAALRALDIRGQHLILPAHGSGGIALLCVTPDCRDETVTLHFARSRSAALPVQFVEHRHGLPPFGDFLRAARGPRATPSQDGDEALLMGELMLPAR